MENKQNIITAVIISLIIGFLLGFAIFNNKQEVSHNGHNDMASMMHDMNASLEGKTGDAFDRAFLAEMIIHHQGAVDMAQKVLEVSQRPELQTLATEIITAQEKEIVMMQEWLDVWFESGE
jgi:uncharacterized protein (DUF305 family)